MTVPVLAHHVVNTLGWRSLRPLQEQAIEPVLAGEDALLLAPTAGGKTEGGSRATRSSASVSPRLSFDGVESSAAYVRESGKDVVGKLVEPTLRLIEGFEGPYELELLSSTHWAAAEGGAMSPREAAEFVRSWTPRKGRLFTDHHVEVAWQHLADQRLLPERLAADVR